LLLIIIWGLLQTETGQNWLARQITKKLSKDLQSRISIDYVKIGFFNKMDLQGVLVEDQRRDTLLYARKVQVRITDWFFFKEQADLQYIGLENATIHLNRADSVWNYRFLEQYFASSGKSQKKAGIEFNLKKAVFSNVTFVQRDAWTGQDFIARVNYLDLDANEISVTKKVVNVSTLALTQPYFSTFTYRGKKPTQAGDTSTKQESDSDWKISIGTITISNGGYRNDRGTLAYSGKGFNSNHIDFREINGTLRNVRMMGDTLHAAIDLATKEKSGFTIQSLKTKATLHPQGMIFDELHLQTPRSVLGDYFALSYDKIGDLADFIHAVTMEANFKKSSIASDDIAYFAPGISNWNRTIKIDGTVKGTVDALTGRDIEVWAGNNTYINGNVSLIGLPNINETLINIEAKDLRTTYRDAVSFIPAIRKITTPNLARLSYVRFKGTYTGFINDFVTFGTLQTNLGTLTTDLNMKFPKRGDPVYSGKLQTGGFQLGAFINNPMLGSVAFNGSVKGKGFEWKTLDMDIDGSVHRIRYGNYTYQNIKAKGRLSNRLFNGDFVIRDPAADLTLTGLIDLSGNLPLFRVKANIVKAKLRTLGLTRENLELSGAFNLDLQGSSLSNLLGDARIYEATLLHNGTRLSFDSLVVASHYVDGLKVLRATSNEFDATITGNFDVATLPNAFTLFLSRYYPSYIKAPANVKPQTFTFDIQTGFIEDYIRLIDTSLAGFNNSHIKGSLDISTNNMTIDATVPYFSYRDKFQFSDVELKGSGDLETLVVTGQVNNAVVSDSLVFPQTTFSIRAQNDVSDFTLNTTANQTINRADVSAQIRTFSDGAMIQFNPSSFVLNGKTWNIEQGGELNFRRNTVVQGQLVLRESDQEIRVETRPSEVGNNWNDLHIALRNINLGDLSPLLLKDNRLEGKLTSDVVIEDPQRRFNVIADNFKVEDLWVDNDSLGQIVGSATYDKTTGLLIVRGNNVDPEHRLNFDVAMDLDDAENTFNDRISINPENFQVKILERFVSGLFSDLQGYVSGNLNIVGEGAARNFVGRARLHNAGMRIGFTQVFYRVDDADINLKEDMIDFGTLKLRDTLGNTATATGNIRHKGFNNMYYDIVVQTDNKPMLLLNTTLRDNQQFYGTAKGTGSLVLVGPQNDMYMNIDARASEVRGDSSFIVLPPSRSRESGQASFMVERKYGRAMSETELQGGSTNMTFEINLTANPNVNVDLILDEQTGDVMRGRGFGNLKIAAGTSSPLSIRGRFDIQEGNYEYTFQSFFKKPFELKKGSNNFIEWTGDPYAANIHLDMVYTAEGVSFAPLAQALPLQDNERTLLTQIRENVTVLVNLSGDLFQPRLNFALEFPANSVIYRNPSISFGIQQLQRNSTELSKQVAYLIVLNSFAPYENFTSTGYRPIQEFAYSTISGLLFSEINRRLNELFSTILRNNDITFNFSGSLYNRNLIGAGSGLVNGINQSNFNVAFGKSLFEGRVNFTVGGTFDVPIQGNFNQTLSLLPDVNVELILNKTGSLRATFFYRENVNYITPGINDRNAKRYGSSLSYNREFESLFGWLFGKKNKGRSIPKDSATTVRKPLPDSSTLGSSN
jgi:hypothetical protein